MEVGNYVLYKGNHYLIVDVRDSKRLILNNEGNKLQVNVSSLTATTLPPAVKLSYRGSEYLVTVKGLIISLATDKVMKWDENHGCRVAILQLAKTKFEHCL